MKRQTLQRITRDRETKRPAAIVTNLTDGRQALFHPDDEKMSLGDVDFKQDVQAAVRADKSRIVEKNGESYFIHVHTPPLRLIVVGAVHITQPLVQMAVLCGFDVTVIDPRGAFATEDRFPDIELSDAWPDEALQDMALDKRAAVITLTHDPKLDDAALHVALKSDVFYIGCLGSNKSHAARVERLRKAGFDDDLIARIHGPIGLDINAKSPGEIAVSIMAEVIQILRTAPQETGDAGLKAAS